MVWADRNSTLKQSDSGQAGAFCLIETVRSAKSRLSDTPKCVKAYKYGCNLAECYTSQMYVDTCSTTVSFQKLAFPHAIWGVVRLEFGWCRCRR